jgi:hypothetical protein
MACPVPSQPPLIFDIPFPQTNLDWLFGFVVCCVFFLLFFLGVTRLIRLTRMLGPDPQRRIFIGLGGVLVLCWVSIWIIILWNALWQSNLDTWQTQESSRLQQGCSSDLILVAYSQAQSSGRWVIYFIIALLFVSQMLYVFLNDWGRRLIRRP